MKYLIILCGIFITVLSGQVIAQNDKYSIINYPNIKTANYIGLPVKTLLTAIKEDYKFYLYINTKRYSWLEGMAFIYHYNDTMDVKLSIKVKDYQYLEPYQWPPYWDLDTFMMEKIDGVELSLVPKNSSGIIQNQNAVHQLWKIKKEQPELFNALNKVYEIWKTDPDTFQDIIRAFEYIEELNNK